MYHVVIYISNLDIHVNQALKIVFTLAKSDGTGDYLNIQWVKYIYRPPDKGA